MPGTYAPPAVELPKTSAIVGMPIADSSVRSWKIWPAGTNRSDWVGRSAPPDSTRLMTGSRLRRAISSARRFLRSVYGFIDAAAHGRVVRDQHALDPGHHADAGDDARADRELGPPRGQRRTARAAASPGRPAARGAPGRAAGRGRGAAARTSRRRPRGPARAARSGPRWRPAARRGWPGTPRWPCPPPIAGQARSPLWSCAPVVCVIRRAEVNCDSLQAPGWASRIPVGPSQAVTRCLQ